MPRERIRLEAVGRFESGGKNREIAAALRVSERSVERRCQWRTGRNSREIGESGAIAGNRGRRTAVRWTDHPGCSSCGQHRPAADDS
ncbi:helix-turn-helix domain-containing protein [Streptomyces sp. NPDC002722]|uniref:helix-turn-helix domain-containing protein n=1 Tax=unclassified Streptomyces TaxID=2593676 RepID=UPI00331BA94A